MFCEFNFRFFVHKSSFFPIPGLTRWLYVGRWEKVSREHHHFPMHINFINCPLIAFTWVINWTRVLSVVNSSSYSLHVYLSFVVAICINFRPDLGSIIAHVSLHKRLTGPGRVPVCRLRYTIVGLKLLCAKLCAAVCK